LRIPQLEAYGIFYMKREFSNPREEVGKAGDVEKSFSGRYLRRNHLFCSICYSQCPFLALPPLWGWPCQRCAFWLNPLLRSLYAAIANRNITFWGKQQCTYLSLISRSEEIGVLFPHIGKIIL
jgi:hypothetical protein